MPLSVVILAAGQGKRMNSDLPKVLQPLAGRPLLAHVIDAARAAGAADIHVVYGHGGERVREALHEDALRWALQPEQLGTGHAVTQAMPGVADDALVLVLYGDVPLVRPETLRRLVAAAGDAHARAALGADEGSDGLRTRGARSRRTCRAHRRAQGRERRRSARSTRRIPG